MDKDNSSLTLAGTDSAPSVLLALAERCEREEPSRELDAEIYIAVFIDSDKAQRIDRLGGVVGWWPINKPYVASVEVAPYTASLDAAVTLVPEGWRTYEVSHLGPSEHIMVGLIIGQPNSKSAHGHAATEPMARCAAALRARAALLTDGAPSNSTKDGNRQP